MIPQYYEFQNAAKILSGDFAIENIPYELKSLGVNNVLILTDKTLEKIGTLQILLDTLGEKNVKIAEIFTDIPPDSSVEIIDKIAEIYNKKIVFSTHPRTAKRIKEKNIKFNDLIVNLEPLGFFDYVKLQKNSYCVLSDSGTVPEESAVLNFPGVTLRTSTERPEALDAGSIVLGGINERDMINAIELAVNSHKEGRENPVKDYRDCNVSEKVVKIIQSYYNIVNERIWKK